MTIIWYSGRMGRPFLSSLMVLMVMTRRKDHNVLCRHFYSDLGMITKYQDSTILSIRLPRCDLNSSHLGVVIDHLLSRQGICPCFGSLIWVERNNVHFALWEIHDVCGKGRRVTTTEGSVVKSEYTVIYFLYREQAQIVWLCWAGELWWGNHGLYTYDKSQTLVFWREKGDSHPVSCHRYNGLPMLFNRFFVLSFWWGCFNSNALIGEVNTGSAQD